MLSFGEILISERKLATIIKPVALNTKFSYKIYPYTCTVLVNVYLYSYILIKLLCIYEGRSINNRNY